MSIRLNQLIVSGPGKPDASVNFAGCSHLVFGPTDTGKSYIVDCLRFGLGGDSIPKGIGWSEGYTTIAVQVLANGATEYTLFRDLIEGNQAVYKGRHIQQPDPSSAFAASIAEVLVGASDGTGRKILTKSGKLGNLTAGDLRHLSLFDEIETLDKVPLVGKDTNLKMRRRSSIALVLSGADDSQAVLVRTTAERNVAKGHVEALGDELEAIRTRLPTGLTRSSAEEALSQVTAEVEKIGSYLRANIHELSALKARRSQIERDLRSMHQRLADLSEAESRFKLLDLKYESDLQRLHALSSATAVVASFDTRPCPLCKMDLAHTERHAQAERDFAALRNAAHAESMKIGLLREGLGKALADLSDDLTQCRLSIERLQGDQEENSRLQAALVQPAVPALEASLTDLTERRSTLTMALRDLTRVEELTERLRTMKTRTKRKTQSIERDVSSSALPLTNRIVSLLKNWGVPAVESVFFDETYGDIHVNQRLRTSYGKGKRGIFLTAYIVAIMEHALARHHPHLGFVVIDSPVVTYKDPKHGSQNPEEALDEVVKDRFYAWLADRKEDGQVVVLENEEPDPALKPRLPTTEFVGMGKVEGRRGFFPG